MQYNFLYILWKFWCQHSKVESSRSILKIVLKIGNLSKPFFDKRETRFKIFSIFLFLKSC